MIVKKEIIQQFKDGNAAAFDNIYNTYSSKLFSFANALLKDPDEATDIVQDVFITLWEKRDQVDIEQNFDNYIFTIVYNGVRKFFRKRSLKYKLEDYLLGNSPDAIEGADGDLIYNELLELANKSLEKLPPKRKEVYLLKKQEGLSVKEIAKKLDISPRTVESHLAKALGFLKKELESISLLTLLFYYFYII